MHLELHILRETLPFKRGSLFAAVLKLSYEIKSFCQNLLLKVGYVMQNRSQKALISFKSTFSSVSSTRQFRPRKSDVVFGRGTYPHSLFLTPPFSPFAFTRIPWDCPANELSIYVRLPGKSTLSPHPLFLSHFQPANFNSSHLLVLC